MIKSVTSQKGYKEALMRILGDGEWHAFEQLFYAVEGTIAPEEATNQFRDWTTPPPQDVDERLRLGKETIVVKAMSNMGLETQGFKSDRASRKFRWRPDMRDVGNQAKEGARMALRALVANPDLAGLFGEILKDEKLARLNPAQRYWLEFALSREPDVAQPYPDEEEATP